MAATVTAGLHCTAQVTLQEHSSAETLSSHEDGIWGLGDSSGMAQCRSVLGGEGWGLGMHMSVSITPPPFMNGRPEEEVKIQALSETAPLGIKLSEKLAFSGDGTSPTAVVLLLSRNERVIGAAVEQLSTWLRIRQGE
ncbi:hypothetical protein GN956_G22973 [Arapaima gigas]